MYNFTITRLSYLPVFLSLFAGGVCVGSLGGIIIGILEKEAIGVLGGAFFGFIIGLLSGGAGLAYTFVFNSLVPLTGGLKLRLDPVSAGLQPAPNNTQPSEQPAASECQSQAPVP